MHYIKLKLKYIISTMSHDFNGLMRTLGDYWGDQRPGNGPPPARAQS
jgi:hypothetical protein